jgi:hypothetical protein
VRDYDLEFSRLGNHGDVGPAGKEGREKRGDGKKARSRGRA